MPQKRKELTITKEQLEIVILKGYGENRACKELGIGPSCYRRHMKAYGLKTIHSLLDNSHISKSRPKCSGCDKKCEIGNVLCRTCNFRCKTRGLKLFLVMLKGGKCEMCGFDKFLSALEFHHFENNKSFEINVTECRKNDVDKYIRESNKCQLLCANCHKSQHEKFSLDNPLFSDKIREHYNEFTSKQEEKNGTRG